MWACRLSMSPQSHLKKRSRRLKVWSQSFHLSQALLRLPASHRYQHFETFHRTVAETFQIGKEPLSRKLFSERAAILCGTFVLAQSRNRKEVPQRSVISSRRKTLILSVTTFKSQRGKTTSHPSCHCRDKRIIDLLQTTQNETSVTKKSTLTSQRAVRRSKSLV